MQRGVECKEFLTAYFSMEIGFKNEIPTYSGGLGILAGDTLKSFADLGIKTVAVTMLSRKGYFHQQFDESGYQHELDNEWDYKQVLTRHDARVTVTLADRQVNVGAWSYVLKGQTGEEVTIYFLDTDLDGNSDYDRTLTDHLYGGDHSYRLHQEIILGIGGVKMLYALGLEPEKFHMNEGHAAFLTLELFKSLGEGDNELKKSLVKHLCSFTTHTPVPAGHDKFDISEVDFLIGKEYLNDYIRSCVVENGKLSTTLLAIEFSNYVNAVARKHRDVSKQMFPKYDIDYITNGVHSVTWTNKHIANLFDTHIVDWKLNPMELRNAHRIPLMELLNAHQRAKQELVDYVNTNYNANFDCEHFTIVFARRAAGYKRIDLILHDIERLKRISNNVGKIQIIYAGKAHPKDTQMKQMIQKIINLKPQLAPAVKMVFVNNYNMYVGQLLTAGADLWLNNPRRPLEASGTSGMKAAHNGVPSLSVPDGWWIEGWIEGETGWSVGDETVHETDIATVDLLDANQIYDKLEHTILPLFYTNKQEYARIMRNAIAINASYFNTHRMVKQYLIRAYMIRCK